MSSTVYIALGSNMGNRELYLHKAIAEIERRIGEVICKSAIYESKAWGFISDQYFLNQTIKIKTNLSPAALLESLKEIESLLGRKLEKEDGYKDRVLDLDILFYDDKILKTRYLTLPHPHIQQRRFVLKPLIEIAGDFVHPKLQTTIDHLLKNCDDQGEVWKYIHVEKPATINNAI